MTGPTSWTAIRDGQFLGLVRGRAEHFIQALGFKHLIQPPVNLLNRRSRDLLQNICRYDANEVSKAVPLTLAMPKTVEQVTLVRV